MPKMFNSLRGKQLLLFGTRPLNAAIEAARAGEYGKGYAVVAAEEMSSQADSLQQLMSFVSLDGRAHQAAQPRAVARVSPAFMAAPAEKGSTPRSGHLYDGDFARF